MRYLDVYQSRINHLGETTAERIRNGGIRSFQKWMAESPHTVNDLSIERGIYFRGIILTNKDKEYTKIMFLNVANDIPLKVGDIMNWPQDNREVEKWLLIQEEKKVNGTYKTFWIVRCNYLIKWIDGEGHLQQSWSYVVSSVDSKIKGNYRTWNSLISPQPNKYAEILLPRRPINRATNFIIEEESWQVIEYDHTSVPGTIYLSLTENKINMVYDDLENNIADTDKRAKYNLVVPPTTQRFALGSEITPVYTIMKNGIPLKTDVEYISSNNSVAKVENGVLTAVGIGEADVEIKVLNCTDIDPDILSLHIEVTDNAVTEFSCYIAGPDTIRLDRKATYQLVTADGEIVSNVIFETSDITLATIIEDGTVKDNDKNNLGFFTLYAYLKDQDKPKEELAYFTKEVKVIPLW